jgi:PST family polysaccharide transporter
VAIGQFGAQIIQLMITLILLRLLTPEDFGLLAMIVVFTGFAELFVTSGYGAAIVQRDDEEELRNSIFWFNLILGVSMTTLFYFLAVPISVFYGEPELVSMIVVLSFIFIFASLNVVQDAIYVKRIDFKVISIRRLISVFLSGIVGVALAFQGFGVWALIIQQVLNYFLKTLLIWIASDWRPGFEFSWSKIRMIFPFTNSLLISGLLNYATRNLDNLLIGKYWGQLSLGSYSKPFNVITFPVKNISSILTRVLFPGLSKIKNDKERTERIYFLLLRMVVFVAWPMMIIIFHTAESIVHVVFGSQWLHVIPLIRVFAISGMLMAYTTLLRSLMVSGGKTNVIYRDGMITNGLIIAGVLVGIKWGILYVAIGKLVADIIGFFFVMHHTNLCIKVGVASQINRLKDLFIVSFFLFGLGFFTPLIQFSDIHLIRIITCACFLLLPYILIAEKRNTDVYLQLKKRLFNG